MAVFLDPESADSFESASNRANKFPVMPNNYFVNFIQLTFLFIQGL